MARAVRLDGDQMGKLTFLGLAERVLGEEKKPLSPYEVWTIAISKGYDQELRSTGKTPSSTLYTSITTDAYRENSKFIKVTDGPARYYLKRLVVASS